MKFPLKKFHFNVWAVWTGEDEAVGAAVAWGIRFHTCCYNTSIYLFFSNRYTSFVILRDAYYNRVTYWSFSIFKSTTYMVGRRHCTWKNTFWLRQWHGIFPFALKIYKRCCAYMFLSTYISSWNKHNIDYIYLDNIEIRMIL